MCLDLPGVVLGLWTDPFSNVYFLHSLSYVYVKEILKPKMVSPCITEWRSWTKPSSKALMPQDPVGASEPSLTRSDPALIDSITPPLYYITSPFTNLKQFRARLGLRPCQRGETLTRLSKRVKESKKRNGCLKEPRRDRLNCKRCAWEDGESWRTGEMGG